MNLEMKKMNNLRVALNSLVKHFNQIIQTNIRL